ncbi:hypothetical protein [Pseudovibrio brasiliensis]|uniref:Holin of 3TMs, for gene-transfer release n=1 Tax=Pseudovibrio brasiliensis TaxID=1898042 RepID=A0ABX8B155_9HYPH|nr:hypothetical protein [Pseudovibrio brasiliensis]QUS59186.1 hypothetical protein KGB56_26945 [Pseudovibrio brasiliensis]
MWGIVWGVVGRLFSLPSADKVLGRVLDTIDNNKNAELDEKKLYAQAVEHYISRVFERRSDAMGWTIWWVGWSLFALPLGLWWCHVLLDTAFSFSWQVDDLPDSVRPWANEVFYSIFGSGVGGAALQSITGTIKGR